MHRIQGWTGLRAAVIALGLVAWTATGATAAPLSYTTSGQVDTTTGVTGTNVVSFVPLSSGNSVDLSTGQTNAGLGNFVISPLARRRTRRLTSNTPIQISFRPVLWLNVDKQRCSGRGQRCAQRRGERAFELDRHGNLKPSPDRLVQSG